MKLTYAFLIMILSIVIQVSLVRPLDIFSFVPNLSLVVLFLLCYSLSFERMLILAIFMGLSIDLVSSVSFGSTILAAFGACSLSFWLRENILKGGRPADLILNGSITFFVFYCLLSGSNIFLGSSSGYMEFFDIINPDLAGEIFFDLALSVSGYYLAERYNSDKIYGFIQNIKISS